MAKATPMAHRERIIELRTSGMSLKAISESENICYVSVWQLCKRYKTQGDLGIKPKYSACGIRKEQVFSDLIKRACRCLKRWHPTWGAQRIRIKIGKKYPAAKLPTIRTMQTWFNKWRLNVKSSKVPKQEPCWAKRVHDVRQVDAKEEMVLADGSKGCWLNITDEYSSAALDPPFFPL